MAKFEIEGKNSLGIQINGYQYPASDDKEYDGNWLNIQLDVDSQIGKWKTVDPCLLTWEVEALIEWLRGAAKGALSNDTFMTFMEPNLSFMISPASKESVFLKVTFDLESLPKGWDVRKDCYLQGNVRVEDLNKAAIGLEAELSKYPKRK